MADYEDRPDWREIDRRKDKSKQYGRQDKDKGERKEKPQNRWQAGRVKEALDRLFMGQKGTVEHDKLYTRMHSSYGSGKFAVHVRQYIEKYGLPDDVSSLLLILDTKERDIVLMAISKLNEVFAGLPLRQKQDINRKLSIIAMTDKDKELRLAAREALDQMVL